MRIVTMILLTLLTALVLTGCGQFGGGGTQSSDLPPAEEQRDAPQDTLTYGEGPQPRQTLFQVFNQPPAENVTKVNRYLWAASLEVMNFLPVQSIDPFTGVIVTGYGTPPGGRSSYRATILIDDPALDARSLNVSLQTRSGPASASTVRAVEDAILTRARQLRVGDSRL